MQAKPDETCSEYLQRAFDYHRECTGEEVEQIATRLGIPAVALNHMTQSPDLGVAVADITRLCEAVPALLPHELLYLRLREEDPGSSLCPEDLEAVRQDYLERARAGALQRGESTSYARWPGSKQYAARRRQDAE